VSERQIIEPYPMFGDVPFPESQEAPEGVIPVKWSDDDFPMVDVVPEIVYQERSGEKQHIQLFKPMQMFPMPGAQPPKYPLIVYVPGSAWHRQMVWMGLNKAVAAVARGYAFAMVEYRPTEVAPFPAQAEDAKSAIRYLRANAEQFGIDKERICVWGDSSGGHTASFVGITGDDYPNEGVCPEESCSVRCVVDWFGPTDISEMSYYPSAMDHHGPDSPEGFLIGQKDVLENMEDSQKTNPINYLSPDKATPPFLIMHGSADNIVPFNQSVLLYEKLKELGREVTFYKLLGAGHGLNGFAGKDALNKVFDFCDEKMK